MDFDDTICQSSRAFVETANYVFCDRPDYAYCNDYTKVQEWNFSDILPYLKPGDVNEIFSSKAFFDLLKPQIYCVDVLNEFKDMYDYCIVSIGTKNNLKHKLDYIDKHFPMIDDLVLLSTESLNMNKKLIDMGGKGNVFLDDHQDNLNSVKHVDHPILFASMGDKPWNKDWHKDRTKDWLEVRQLLNKYLINK